MLVKRMLKKDDDPASLDRSKTLVLHQTVMEMIMIKTDNRCRQTIKLITISWLPKVKEASARAINKLKVMRTSLEFHLE